MKSSFAIFNFLSAAGTILGSSVAQQPIDCSDFQFSQQLSSELRFDYVAVVDDETTGQGTLKGRLILEGLAWAAIGVSSAGMVPGEAIIGSDAGVLKYNLSAKNPNGVNPTWDQTLTDTSFVQNGTHTVVEFTKILQEANENPLVLGSNNFIWSHGSSNTLAYHANRGVAVFEIQACGAPSSSTASWTATPAESPASNPTGTPQPTTAVPSSVNDPTIDFPTVENGVNCAEFQQSRRLSDDLLLEYVVNTDGESDILIGRLTLDRETWLAFGVTSSAAGSMFPSNVIIGKPDEEVSLTNPGKYSIGARALSAIQILSDDRQTLINATLVQNDGQTIMSFSKILVEPDEVGIEGDGLNTFIFSYGVDNNFGQHASSDRGAVRLTLTACTPGSAPVDESSSEAGDDGVITTNDYQSMWTAHGTFAAIAWGILTPLAIASSLLRDFFPREGLWFTAHLLLNLSSSLATVIAFSLAVAAVQMGTLPGEEPNHFVENAHRTVGLVIFCLTFFQVIAGLLRPHAPKSLDNGTVAKKTPLRFAWELMHKLMGFSLLGMAWWQCQSGLKLYASRFGATTITPTIFLGFVGGIAAVTALLWVYARCTNKHAGSDKAKSGGRHDDTSRRSGPDAEADDGDDDVVHSDTFDA